MQKILKQDLNRPLPKGINKKVIGLVKDELGGQITKEFVGLRAKTYTYLKDNDDEDNKAKGTIKDDKRIQTIDYIETYAYGTSKDLVSEKEEIK